LRCSDCAGHAAIGVLLSCNRKQIQVDREINESGGNEPVWALSLDGSEGWA
jgi:hypothetical protein